MIRLFCDIMGVVWLRSGGWWMICPSVRENSDSFETFIQCTCMQDVGLRQVIFIGLFL